MKKAKKQTVIATPPGHTIRERLDTIGMTLCEFAERMGMKDTEVTDLLHGRTKITPNLAAKLESVIDIPSRFWLKLEEIYRKKAAFCGCKKQQVSKMINNQDDYTKN